MAANFAKLPELRAAADKRGVTRLQPHISRFRRIAGLDVSVKGSSICMPVAGRILCLAERRIYLENLGSIACGPR